MPDVTQNVPSLAPSTMQQTSHTHPHPPSSSTPTTLRAAHATVAPRPALIPVFDPSVPEFVPNPLSPQVQQRQSLNISIISNRLHSVELAVNRIEHAVHSLRSSQQAGNTGSYSGSVKFEDRLTDLERAMRSLTVAVQDVCTMLTQENLSHIITTVIDERLETVVEAVVGGVFDRVDVSGVQTQLERWLRTVVPESARRSCASVVKTPNGEDFEVAALKTADMARANDCAVFDFGFLDSIESRGESDLGILRHFIASTRLDAPSSGSQDACIV
jgi:hypothetical protein